MGYILRCLFIILGSILNPGSAYTGMYDLVLKTIRSFFGHIGSVDPMHIAVSGYSSTYHTNAKSIMLRLDFQERSSDDCGFPNTHVTGY